MEYYVDFCGTIVIKARNREEAEDKFWAWADNTKMEHVDLDLIEEKEE